MNLPTYMKLTTIESLFQSEPPRPKEWYEELEENVCAYCPQMTWQQRLSGCLAFMVLGFLISMGSTLRLITLLKGNPVPFAIMYTTGNIIRSGLFIYLFIKQE